MKYLVIFLLFAVAFSHFHHSHNREITTFGKFMEFVNTHKKVYGNFEVLQAKYNIFKQNLQKLNVLKSVQSLHDHTDDVLPHDRAGFGITQFFDLTAEEFQNTYLNLKVDHLTQLRAENSDEFLTAKNVNDTPAAWDWREHGAVTEIKNQGSCGSCWAFSAIGNIEGQYAIKNKEALSFSPQQLVDCDKVDQGCNGGLMDDAFKYAMSQGGLNTEADYPYEGRQKECRYVESKNKAKVTGFKFAESQDEEQIKTMLYETGPLAVALNATPLQFYFFGIFNPWFSFICPPKNLNHGVLIVGYGVSGSKKFWIVKNSWGSWWGEKGYFRIIAGKGACGINTFVVTSTLE